MEKDMSMKIKRKRKKYSIIRSVHELEKIMLGLPEDEVYKMVTCGNFSSISVVIHVAHQTKIHNLYASSFRIGRKQLQAIDALRKSGRIGKCYFAVGTLMKNDSETGKQYHYYDLFEEICKKNGWEYATVNNHSKILLFDTDAGKYVLETSSNLNENPKIEQLSFEKDEELYEFYRSIFEGWMKDG